MMSDLPLPDIGNVVACLVIALATAIVAFTLSQMKVAESFRDWVEGKSEWLGKLLACPYCVSFWLVFVAIVIYRPRLIELFWPVDLLVTAFATITVNVFIISAIGKAIRG